MADLSDVETAILGYVTAAIYPDGVEGTSQIGAQCRLYRGWPTAKNLNADLAAGTVNITIFPDAAQGSTTTRYSPTWSSSTAVPTLTATVSGHSVRLGGSAQSGGAVGVSVDRRPYDYQMQSADTPELIAAKLAALIQPDRIVVYSGAKLDFPGAGSVIARVISGGTSCQELRRQQREIRVICWCPTPILRDVSSSIIDTALVNRAFIQLSDHSQARISYTGTQVYDQSQNALLYRRDLLYTIEYATIATMRLPAMLFGNFRLNADNLVV